MSLLDAVAKLFVLALTFHLDREMENALNLNSAF